MNYKTFVITVKTKNGEDCFLYLANDEKEAKAGVLKFIKRDSLSDIREQPKR